jgi:hypothetical protein
MEEQMPCMGIVQKMKVVEMTMVISVFLQLLTVDQTTKTFDTSDCLPGLLCERLEISFATVLK